MAPVVPESQLDDVGVIRRADERPDDAGEGLKVLELAGVLVGLEQ
jgi:hypothetical protein